MEHYLVPHTKSSVNPGIQKYHDLVRTRQQLHFEDKNMSAGIDSLYRPKAFAVELHGSNTADHKNNPFFLDHHASSSNSNHPNQ